MSDWLTYASASITIISTIVTATATVFLWKFTRVLAIETKNLAEATQQPQVVANLELNKSSNIHWDLIISNTGNSTAFDITITFDPPLSRDQPHQDREIPLQHVSLLRPNQMVSSYLCKFASLKGNNYRVNIEWRRSPEQPYRDRLSYIIKMTDIEGSIYIGPRDPLIQISRELKKMEETITKIRLSGIDVNVFTVKDRNKEREDLEKYWEDDNKIDLN